jgi:hypothetical protein
LVCSCSFFTKCFIPLGTCWIMSQNCHPPLQEHEEIIIIIIMFIGLEPHQQSHSRRFTCTSFHPSIHQYLRTCICMYINTYIHTYMEMAAI